MRRGLEEGMLRVEEKSLEERRTPGLGKCLGVTNGFLVGSVR
jgi:hypothetical protein